MAEPGALKELDSKQAEELDMVRAETVAVPQMKAGVVDKTQPAEVDLTLADFVHIRPRFFEDDAYAWDMRRVPNTTSVQGATEPHPAKHISVFVVHGMGEQQWTETASNLRASSEDALDAIRRWEADNHKLGKAIREPDVAPPFVLDGYWADYANLEKTFPEDWKEFNDREQAFFSHLWQVRTYGLFRTYFWLLRQQLRLIHPRVIWQVSPVAWLLYLPLQVLGILAWTLALLRQPKILTRTIADLRIYADPHGIVERAIVQRIDKRVGDAFLQLIGLDEEFRPIADQHENLQASGHPFVSDRVVWVAHSLGTAISYNVLSDLFSRAGELEKAGDDLQKEGVKKFRGVLRRFVTLGSPLDKFAYLFPQSLRPWPQKARSELLSDSGDSESAEERGSLYRRTESRLYSTLSRSRRNGRQTADSSPEEREWWINFYNVLDPVSGALGHAKKDPAKLYGKKPPLNVHTTGWSSWIPAWSHTAYWLDGSVVRYVLSRVYGRQNLPDKDFQRSSSSMMIFRTIGYIVWAFVLYGAVILLVVYRSTVLSFLWKTLVSSIKALFA